MTTATTRQLKLRTLLLLLMMMIDAMLCKEHKCKMMN